MDRLITRASKYGPIDVYIREDGTVYARINGRELNRENPVHIGELRAHILDVWRPQDQEGQSAYRQLAARADANPWYG